MIWIGNQRAVDVAADARRNGWIMTRDERLLRMAISPETARRLALGKRGGARSLDRVDNRPNERRLQNATDGR